MPHDLCKARGWMRRLALGLTVLAAVGAEAQQSKKKAALPTFPDGPNKGRYAVYQHAKFNAWIDATGTPWVQPLDAGKPVGKPFSCHAVSPYYNPEAAHKGRPIAEFISPAPPAVIPATGGKIKLQGKLEEDVPFEVEYEFKGNVIIAAGGCKRSFQGAISHPVPPAVQFPGDAQFHQRHAARDRGSANRRTDRGTQG